MEEIIKENIEFLKNLNKKRGVDLINIVYQTSTGRIVENLPEKFEDGEYSILFVINDYKRIVLTPPWTRRGSPFRKVKGDIIHEPFTTDGDFNVLWSIENYNHPFI